MAVSKQFKGLKLPVFLPFYFLQTFIRLLFLQPFSRTEYPIKNQLVQGERTQTYFVTNYG